MTHGHPCLSFAACAADPEASCTSLCTGSGFDEGMADVQPNEVNCFCSGGTGEVLAEECTSMCTSIGKSTGEVFGTMNESCQCA